MYIPIYTIGHLLLHCEKAHRLWSLVFRSFWISCVLPRPIGDTLFGWWNWLGKHSSSILECRSIVFNVVYLE